VFALQNAILTNTGVASIATDASGVIQIFNLGAERLLGYAAIDVVNQFTLFDLFDKEQTASRAAASNLELGTSLAVGFEALVSKAAHGKEETVELTVLGKAGNRFPGIVTITALRGDESIIGYLFIICDGSARNLAENEMRVSEFATGGFLKLHTMGFCSLILLPAKLPTPIRL
jgi:PAS domain S-box-containing protein